MARTRMLIRVCYGRVHISAICEGEPRRDATHVLEVEPLDQNVPRCSAEEEQRDPEPRSDLSAGSARLHVSVSSGGVTQTVARAGCLRDTHVRSWLTLIGAPNDATA